MPNPILTEGSRGASVLKLTRILEELGHLEFPGEIFDRTVLRAVEEFQSRYVDELGRPLVVDGLVGPLTWWALENETSVLAPPVGVDFTVVPANGGSQRGRAALTTAISEIRAGAREIGADNSGPFVQKYLNGLSPTPANWCAGFVSWCFAQHANGIPYQYSVGARDIRFQFRERGWLLDDNVVPEPGDIIVWWRGQPNGWKGHIGLVHHSSNGIVFTIEGNKGRFPAPVRGFDYVLSRMPRLLGFGRVRD
jgi:hypothetical protein